MAILKNYFIPKNYKISETKGCVLNIHNLEIIFIRKEYLNKHGLLPVFQTEKSNEHLNVCNLIHASWIRGARLN